MFIRKYEILCLFYFTHTFCLIYPFLFYHNSEMRDTFDPKSWSYNGPAAIKRVLNRICPNNADCKDLKMFPPKYFYPVHYSQHKMYFQNGTLSNIDNPYMHHMWNYLTKDSKIEKNSPYAVFARQFCPEIYKMYGDEFGE